MATLTHEDRADGRWIRVAGELDREGCSAIAEPLGTCLAGEATPVVLDMGAVTFVASQGLRLVLDAHKTLKHQGRVLQLARLRGAVRDAFVTTGLLDAIPLLDD